MVEKRVVWRIFVELLRRVRGFVARARSQLPVAEAMKKAVFAHSDVFHLPTYATATSK
jgi:hypothetical protein